MYRAQPSDWLLGTQRKPGVLAPEAFHADTRRPNRWGRAMDAPLDTQGARVTASVTLRIRTGAMISSRSQRPSKPWNPRDPLEWLAQKGPLQSGVQPAL
jgi:hypothetical protein